MGGAPEPAGTPPPVERGFATLATLRVGVKAMVAKDNEKRKAEILSIQQRKGRTTFYVHYEDFNKRLDEWVSAERIDLSQEVEWPAPEKPAAPTKKGPHGAAASAAANKASKKDEAAGAASPGATQQQLPGKKNNLKRPRSKLEREFSGTPETTAGNNRVAGAAGRKSAGGKENDDSVLVTTQVVGTPKPDDEELDLVDVQVAAAAAKGAAPEVYSREEEIEKLRTGGSMTQNQAEISRVRNLEKIQMGKHEIEPWYFSPYPVEFGDADVVHICEFCLSYFGEQKQFERHRSKCTLTHPPGNEIYRDDFVSFFEIDGRRQRTWCRNLCLLSKLFLDHKTLYYDVDPFLFYCMATRDEYGCHLVGYFSKEKESAEGYNVACILTLPQHQRMGFGRLLIQFSYELSRREGKLGSPEKPLSDLGLLSYRAYWQETIVDILMDGRTECNVEDLAYMAAMTTNDVLHTLQNLNMIRTSRNQHVIVLTDVVVAQRDKQKARDKIKGKHNLDAKYLIWKPPVFSASSRTWNW